MSYDMIDQPSQQEPSDYVDDMAIVAVVSCAVVFGFIAGLLYGLAIGG